MLLPLTELWSQNTRCPDLDIYEILQDPVVQEGLDRAWRDSREGTENEHEEGGWIIHVYEDGSEDQPCREYRTDIERWPVGGEDGISPTPKPTGDNMRVVAEFHTHPGPAFEFDYYNHVPSIEDLRVSEQNKIPGIIRYGTGASSANTYDIIYDGSRMRKYDLLELEVGLDTHLAGFYDSRIASADQMANAGYEAQEPEWRCEDLSALPVSTTLLTSAYETESGMTPNPENLQGASVTFDYRLKLALSMIRGIEFETNVYVNSADGSFMVIEEDIEQIGRLLRTSGIASVDETFEFHYIIYDSQNDALSKLTYLGKDSRFEEDGTPSLVGYSFTSPVDFFIECFLRNIEKTDATTRYKGNSVPWYEMEVTDLGETAIIRLAMKPTELTSDALYFSSFVGIMKDDTGRQNYLVTHYETEGLEIELLDLKKLSRTMTVDLSEYTMTLESDATTGESFYKSGISLTDIQGEVAAAYQKFGDCTNSLPRGAGEAAYKACWDKHVAPLREKYPHYVPEFGF